MFPNLTAPLTLGETTVRNRAVVTAHVTNYGSHEHLATERTAAYLRERARGGAGMIVSESLAVHPSAGPNTFFLKLWDDSAIEPLRAVTEAVRGEGAVFVAQLNHGGREHNPAITRRPLVAPSPIASPKGGEIPHELTSAEIAELVESFSAAAGRAMRAGFDGVEVHAGHGYLLQQFLSPWSNQRSDDYGGSLDNRMRMLLEVLEAARQVVPRPALLGLRISADEFAPDGLGVTDMQQITERIVATGLIDYLSVSQGSYADPRIFIPDASFGHAPFLHLTRAIRQASGTLPLVAVGSIVTPAEAEQVLTEGIADLVGMTRAHIADPHLMRKAGEGRPEDIRQCILCNQGCFNRLLKGIDISCVQNPAVGFEREWPEFPVPDALESRRVVVVGAGPGGLECAWVAAARGHRVTLLEAGSELGGSVRSMVAAEDLREWEHVISWRERMLDQLGVEVRTECSADAGIVLELGPDVVVLASGTGSHELAAQLSRQPELIVHTIGDAAAPRDAFAAITDGHRIGREI